MMHVTLVLAQIVVCRHLKSLSLLVAAA